MRNEIRISASNGESRSPSGVMIEGRALPFSARRSPSGQARDASEEGGGDAGCGGARGAGGKHGAAAAAETVLEIIPEEADLLGRAFLARHFHDGPAVDHAGGKAG